jgi:hypothetical protein
VADEMAKDLLRNRTDEDAENTLIRVEPKGILRIGLGHGIGPLPSVTIASGILQDPSRKPYQPWPAMLGTICAVTQHTTACCSMQVVDITLAEQASTNITSLRVVQQKHCGPKYKLNFILLQTKA